MWYSSKRRCDSKKSHCLFPFSKVLRGLGDFFKSPPKSYPIPQNRLSFLMQCVVRLYFTAANYLSANPYAFYR